MIIHERNFTQTNPFVEAFVNDFSKVTSFFSYNPKDEQLFQKRQAALANRTYQRKELAEALYRFNQKYDASDLTLHNIKRLEENNSLVVVGGQQAGILTGPLLVIYKAMSVLFLAKEQEQKLGVPVIPVFWIAGEDHDFDEVNHIFITKEKQIQKNSIAHLFNNRKAISDLSLPKKELMSFIDEMIASFGEREYTKELREMLHLAAEKSTTYTDFFAYLMVSLFKEQGLVLLDSNDPNIRLLEREFFIEIVKKNEPLHQSVYEQLEKMEKEGFSLPFEKRTHQANLFTFVDRERYLLERTDHGFHLKNGEVYWTKDEMIKAIEKSPEQFSNNVVTRPLMQEYLLPTLAFIGGPGEIHYWGSLKNAFSLFDFEMPPVCLRLSYTLIERHIAKWMKKLVIQEKHIAMKTIKNEKEHFITSIQTIQTKSVLERLFDSLHLGKKELQVLGQKVDATLPSYIEHTFQKIWSEIERVDTKIKQTQVIQHENVIEKYEAIETSLLPQMIFQERFWSIWYYMNAYGLDLVDRLIQEPVTLDESHKIVYL